MFIINSRNQIFNGKFFKYLEKDEDLAKYNLQEIDEKLLQEIVDNMGCEIIRYENEDEVVIKRVEIISYKEAIWDIIKSDMLLCNNIEEIDNSIFDEAINYHSNEDGDYPEIYQYFLCSLDKYDIEYLEETYPEIIIGYSKKLDLDVLMVDHCGSSWDIVDTYKFINN